MHEWFGTEKDADREKGAQDQSQDHAIEPLGEGSGPITRPEKSSHRGGGGVGQEDAQPDNSGDEDGGRPQPRQGAGAQRAHDGCIDEKKDRVRNEGTEGGQA